MPSPTPPAAPQVCPVTPTTRPLLLLLFCCALFYALWRVEAFPSMPFSISTSFSTFLHLPSALGRTRFVPPLVVAFVVVAIVVVSLHLVVPVRVPPAPLSLCFCGSLRGACENCLFNYSVTFDLLLLLLLSSWSRSCCCCCCV